MLPTTEMVKRFVGENLCWMVVVVIILFYLFSVIGSYLNYRKRQRGKS